MTVLWWRWHYCRQWSWTTGKVH